MRLLMCVRRVVLPSCIVLVIPRVSVVVVGAIDEKIIATLSYWSKTPRSPCAPVVRSIVSVGVPRETDAREALR